MMTKTLWKIFVFVFMALNIFVDGEHESHILLAMTVACVLFYYLAWIIDLLEERDS